jgi:hypothetical protein
MMSAQFQIVIDCKDPVLLASFWAAALGYVLEPPPEGFATWDDWRRDIGFPESELAGMGADSIVDADGGGPRIWFRADDAAKVVKNRLHFDIRASGGRSFPLATRRQRVDAEASRLAGLGATITGALGVADGFDHYAVGMKDPEGNEFDIN